MENLFYLYTDGSYSPELNHSTIGGLMVNQNNEVIFEFSDSIENLELLRFHELLAMYTGLKKALEYHVKNIVCFSDDLSIANFNKLTYLTDHYKNIHKRDVMTKIMNMKHHFEFIEFKHIKRKFNKKADKLAGQGQINYFYHHIHFKQHFEIEDKKKLIVPNLICTEKNFNQIISQKELQEIQQDLIKQANQLKQNIYISIKPSNEKLATIKIINLQNNEILSEKSFEIKRVNAYALNALSEALNKFLKLDNNIVIYTDIHDLALKKFEMVLRGRFIFPKLKTPLVDRFLLACSRFEKIILLEHPTSCTSS